MSDSRGRGPIPPRWLHCPRKAIKLIRNKFLAFKTPLCASFDSQVSAECRFTIDMLFSSLKSQRVKLGLWIDLTNTSRFYEKGNVEAHGCKYLKLQCRGHGETPSLEQTKTFVQVCENFIAKHPLEIIGIHCTHGFNRTGFLLISYLVEMGLASVDAGLAEFAAARPPGIYKADYIQELFKRYDEDEDPPPPPVQPAWCLEYDDSNVEDTDEATSSDAADDCKSDKKRKREFRNKNPVFMEGVPGVTPLTDGCKISGIQRRVQEMCGWKASGFPGSQPVSMDRDNVRLLHKKPYRVSWKADGTRYMMLIQGDGELYFIDRDNSVFKIDGLTFPHPTDKTRTLGDTLLDGEMVIDKFGDNVYPRYLAYDIIMFDGRDVSKKPFYPDRYSIIEEDVIGGRCSAMQEGRLIRESEPFSVRHKEFWDVSQAERLVSDKFAKQLCHEPDGLIFQPGDEPYSPGASRMVLKWKPLCLNSVDFRLKIVTECGAGLLTRRIGQLFVGGMNEPFSQIKITKAIKELNNKIIECKYDNEQSQWIFMRERTDKSFPNSYNTAMAVCQSIREPVTTEGLLKFIHNHRFGIDDAELMPPPDKHRSVQVWCTKNLASKDRKSLRINLGYDHATHVRWSPDVTAFIVHNSNGNSMDVWKLTKSTKKGDFPIKSATKVLEFPKKHDEDVVGMDIACNGRYIITCSTVNDLIVWDLKGEQLATIDTYLGSTHRARISPCGRFVAASGFTPDVKVWEVVFTKSGEFKQVSKAFDLAGHSSGIYDFNFCADTSHMASVSKDGTYRFYDTKIEFEKGEDPRLLSKGSWDVATPASLAVSPNGEVVVIAHSSSLTFYSTVTGDLDTMIEDIFNGPITCLTFDAVGDYVLVAGDKHIKIFHNVTGYRAALKSANQKLAQRQTSATKERLEETITKCEKFLEEIGEPLVQ